MALPKDINQLLEEWSRGDQDALNDLMPLVYDELRRIAGRHLRRVRPDNIIQTTVLVHEAFLRLIDQKSANYKNRVHFFAVASKAMRQILVNYALARMAAKRSGGIRKLSLNEAKALVKERDWDIAALDEALKALEAVDPHKSELIELRFFGGLTLDETAEALGVSPSTVDREWKLAKAWLLRELVNKDLRDE